MLHRAASHVSVPFDVLDVGTYKHHLVQPELRVALRRRSLQSNAVQQQRVLHQGHPLTHPGRLGGAQQRGGTRRSGWDPFTRRAKVGGRMAT